MKLTDLLHDIDTRLARVEERTKDIASLHQKLDKIDARCNLLNAKVSGTAATVAIITTVALTLLAKVLL